MKMKNLLSALCLGVAMPVIAGAEEADLDRMIAPEEIRQDFAALYEGLQSAHYNLYVNLSEPEYDALYDAFLARVHGPESLYDVTLMFQEFTALGDVAHANISIGPLIAHRAAQAESGRFPITPRVEEGRLYVLDNLSGEEDILPGDEIVSINNRAASQWLAFFGRYVSADTPRLEWSQIDGRFQSWMLIEPGPLESFDVAVRTGRGEVRHYQVAGKSPEDLESAALNQPDRFELGFYDREARMIDNGIAYLRPGPFFNVETLMDESLGQDMYDATGFIAFIDDAFQTFINEGAESLIIDIRHNPGGDNSFSDPMIAWFADEPFRFASEFRVRSSPEAEASNQKRLDEAAGAANAVSLTYAEKYKETPYGQIFGIDIPQVDPRGAERFDGDVYVLIDRQSYSNAVNVAAIIKDYGFGTLLGEETTDFATTYGAMETFRLPVTNIEVGFPKAHIIRPSGEREPGGLKPDIAIKTPIVPGQDDVVLQEALSLIRRGNQ